MSNLTAKIHAIRQCGLAAVKTGEVKGKFRFASFADVWSVLMPALLQHNLSVGFGNAALVFDQLGHEAITMDMEVSDGTETHTVPFSMVLPEKILNASGSSVTNSCQRTGGATTYLRRTALISYFSIVTGDEDEVERMTPAPGQHNIPGLILVNSATRWQDLTDGAWRDVMSPLDDGKTSDHEERGEAHMRDLWRGNPDHPAMMAWGADWLCGKLQDTGMSWKDVAGMDASLPEHMANCTGKQLRTACALITGNLKPKEA